MTEIFTRLQNDQRKWALQYKGSTKFTGYQDNLFEELEPDAKNEYAGGDGHELKSHMHSVISSSALCCNFFHYWRYHDPRKLCQALGIHGNVLQVRFEAKPEKPAGIGGRNPNIDVLITSDNLELTAIECKYTETCEPLSLRSQANMPLAAAYFTEGISLWKRMPRCHNLAKRLPHLEAGDVSLRYLGAGQLIKHALGLLNSYPWKNWRLVYLWYESDPDVDQAHRNEIRRFTAAIGDDFRFESTTYQAIFSQLCKDPDIKKNEWANYMRQRYFPEY